MPAEVVKLKASHIYWLKEKGAFSYLTPYLREDNIRALENARFAFTALTQEGEVLGCAGVVEFWEGRGEAWAAFNPNCKNYFILLHKMVKRFLEIAPFTRIEAVVDLDFPEGHRWIKTLGFELEAPLMRGYTVTGKDSALYAKVKL